MINALHTAQILAFKVPVMVAVYLISASAMLVGLEIIVMNLLFRRRVQIVQGSALETSASALLKLLVRSATFKRIVEMLPVKLMFVFSF